MAKYTGDKCPDGTPHDYRWTGFGKADWMGARRIVAAETMCGQCGRWKELIVCVEG